PYSNHFTLPRLPPRWQIGRGFRLHPLKGDRAGQWSVRVSGNWRVVFRFEDGEAVDVDLIDYH
ncbi:MAG: type II toxin-antitoxin system RelE/ParE family toxin, partial [Gemmatimonadota bacterium]|nr:type II toxin-antitoxin system RelE/ParE family toxin [Gemmatimonadota bacterium]MDE2872991.1 type II toxin-antitoxin system RelE/ParE family toxin [Gemmatimonadota bacterium]